MTDRLFRTPGWTAPVLLAPCAAAMFGASVWWATGAVPTTETAQPGAATGASAPSQDHSQAMQRYLEELAKHRRALHSELAHALDARRHEADVLRQRIRQIQSEVAKAKTAAAAASAYQPPPINYGAPAPVAPVQVGPAPAPAPPPVQANTGASGAVP